jgi:hypothetical protein
MTRKWFVIAAVAATITSCGSDSPPETDEPPLPNLSCRGLYGAPNENTGLSDEECFPRIENGETWLPRVWDDEGLAELRAWTLENPPPLLTEDPFITMPDLEPDEDAVCAVMITGADTYRTETFLSVGEAEAAGGIVTHGIACGACSSLEDLAAYAERPDQTDPVRQCTIENIGGTVEELEACIQEEVGFTQPCARAWAYNAINDGRECQSICIAELDSPYNEEDGSLNPCLQCDEDESGPVFKSIAGRTRRSSGLAAAICRPCEQVWRVDHLYE